MADPRRYNTVAMTLHWLIAALILINIGLAWAFNGLPLGLTPEMHGPSKIALLQLHKPIGIAVLVLSLARLAWRFISPPPPLPASVAGWERVAANSVYVLFYVFLIAMPLTGWLLVSASKTIAVYPINFFGLHWPAIAYFTNLPHDIQHTWHERFSSYHTALAWLAYALLILHVGAALRHQFIKRDTVLWRMAPLVGRPT